MIYAIGHREEHIIATWKAFRYIYKYLQDVEEFLKAPFSTTPFNRTIVHLNKILVGEDKLLL